MTTVHKMTATYELSARKNIRKIHRQGNVITVFVGNQKNDDREAQRNDFGGGKEASMHKSVTAPVKTETTEKPIEKFENPPIVRNSSCAYPNRESSVSSFF